MDKEFKIAVFKGRVVWAPDKCIKTFFTLKLPTNSNIVLRILDGTSKEQFLLSTASLLQPLFVFYNS